MNPLQQELIKKLQLISSNVNEYHLEGNFILITDSVGSKQSH